MKNAIISGCLLLLTISLPAQDRHLSLTPIRFGRRVIEVPEGTRIRIRPVDRSSKSLSGVLRIINNNLIMAGSDTIKTNNIKKLFFKTSNTTTTGAVLTGLGLAMTIGGSIWLSTITLDEDPFIATLQAFGGLLLLGGIELGIILTTVGVIYLIRGKAFKTYGNHGYNIRVAG